MEKYIHKEKLNLESEAFKKIGFPNFTSTNSYKKKEGSSMFPEFHKWLQFPNSMTDATISTYSEAAINYHQASP